jgi:hypothetical protein
MPRTLLAVMVLCAMAAPVRAFAQQIADDAAEQARIRLGPIGVTPSVALTRLGVDTNVFNEFEDPKRDFTFTLSPQLNAWARAGRARLHVAGRSDLVYFERYSSERSMDGTIAGRFEMRGARFTPWASAGYTAGRQRIGYEVDLRFRRTVDDVSAGVEARAGARTRLAFNLQRSVYDHDPDATFGSRNLREVLNRRNHSAGLHLRYALTPLTTFVLSGEASRDRFDFAAERNTRSTRIDTGFDLAPSALISGRGRVGYRRLEGVSGDVPEYSGLVASVAAGSTIGGRTRIEVATQRDVTYSWEPDYPYYVLSGATVTATPRLTERWDVQARLGGYRLAYLPLAGVTHLLADRVDTYHVRGGGVGLHIGEDLRIGFDVDREHRTSPVRQRFYAGYRAGLSVTYGR